MSNNNYYLPRQVHPSIWTRPLHYSKPGDLSPSSLTVNLTGNTLKPPLPELENPITYKKWKKLIVIKKLLIIKNVSQS